MKSPYEVVYSVLVTEKATLMQEKYNKVLFKVNPACNKIEIRQAVEAIFKDDGVTVSAVNVINVLGKNKRMRSARMGKRPDWKKAIVTLAAGNIDVIG